MNNLNKKLLYLIFSLCIIIIICIPILTPSKIISYQSNYYDFYTPFSDIYIKDIQPIGNSVIIFFYPDGMITFTFKEDETIKKEFKNHFIEITRMENDKYITITDTNIPFLSKINPNTWGTPIGNNNDFKIMKELFKISRNGDCSVQTDFIINLANEHNIIIRRINLWQSPINGILTAEGHTTIEIYDRKTKQWIWMDPLYNIIEGRIDNKSITLYELQMGINQNKNITLITTNNEEILFNQWQYNKKWKNYLNPSQKISYIVSGNRK